jgi:ubiquinone/menaquinone biosynthesis C-methylase UbiE
VAEIVATDISREMIAIAEQKRTAAGAANTTFVQADAGDIHPGAPFDVITAFSLLHLLDDLPMVLNRVYAQLKPGGLFLSKTVCLGDASLPLRAFVRGLGTVGLAPAVTPLRRSDVRHALVQAGFDLVECRYFGSGRLNPFIVAQRPF